MVRDRLDVQVTLCRAVPVYGHDQAGEVCELHLPERRAQLLEDALVVVTAPLERDPVAHPVLDDVLDDVLSGGRLAQPPAPLVRFELLLPQPQEGGLVVVDDRALPNAVLVDPADAPLVVVLDGLGHRVAP